MLPYVGDQQDPFHGRQKHQGSVAMHTEAEGRMNHHHLDQLLLIKLSHTPDMPDFLP
jgi:hypothetical protein